MNKLLIFQILWPFILGITVFLISTYYNKKRKKTIDKVINDIKKRKRVYNIDSNGQYVLVYDYLHPELYPNYKENKNS